MISAWPLREAPDELHATGSVACGLPNSFGAVTLAFSSGASVQAVYVSPGYGVAPGYVAAAYIAPNFVAPPVLNADAAAEPATAWWPSRRLTPAVQQEPKFSCDP
jgi:hypothetical protein